MSFELRLTPDFAAQKRKLLALKSAPPLAIPASTEECLGGFTARGPAATAGLWSGIIASVRPLLLKAVVVSFCASITAASSSLLAMRILKPGQTLGIMLLMACGYFAMNAATLLAVFASGRLRTWVGLSAETFLVALVSRKLLRLSAVAAARQSSGNLKVLITSDAKNVGMFLDNVTRNFVPAMTALVAIVPLLVHFAGRAGLYGVCTMALILPVSLALNQISMRLETRSQAELDALTSLAGEWVKNVRLIRYLSWDEAFREDVARGLRKFMKVAGSNHFMACLIFGLSTSWWMVSISGVLVAARLTGHRLDLVSFFGSLWLLTFLSGYFTHLPNTIRLYGQAAPSVRRIARLLSEEEQEARLGEGEPIGEGVSPRRLLLERVSFAYPGGKTAVDDVTLELDLSRKLAVIGEIGSGKTTLLKLICGEYPPTSGRILVELDDGSVRDLWTREAYALFRASLASVPQEAFVSSDLLGRNVSLSTEAEHPSIVDAAYWAELEADLALLPEGLSQEIGESGVNLSGGQRQRLNLARARFARRPYLVLDDTLSAVDTKTERLLMERLTALEDGFVLVTHRTAELMRVEQVVVMSEGRVVEQGTPAALAAVPGSLFNQVIQAYERV